MAAEKYDDVLLPFLTLMRRELHANAGKGDRPGWLRMNPDTALLEVYYHLAKLQKAVKHNDGPAIMEYGADVANMAMMVLDICGSLAWVDQPERATAHPTLLALWQAVCEEAECVITGGKKCLILTEEMLVRMGGAIEDACGVALPDGAKNG
jgi:hypothetical protein